MSIRDWFRPKNATLKEPEFLRQSNNSIFGGTGISVTPEDAMKVSAVFGCVRILAETVASLPLKVYRTTPNGREAVNHPLNDILGVTVNGEQTAMEFREFQMSSLGLRGNAYSVISRSNRGGIGSIDALKPAFMHIDRDANQRLVFDYQEPGNNNVYPADRIWRVAALGSDGVTGLSPIGLAKESIGVAIATEQTAARLFSNGTQASMTLNFDRTLTEDQINNLRNQFADNYAGYKNAHKPLILESGMTANKIGLNADEAQFLQSRKFQIAEIARWYRVPLHMLNELDKATFSNIEHQSIEFVMHTIRPWLVRIEQTIARDLLTRQERNAGLYVSHTVEGLLRGDSASRYAAYSSAITNGWMSRNEVRRLENLNPEDGLDDFVLPLNMSAGESTDVTETEAEVLNRLAESEITILAKESKNRGDSFAGWVVDYYSRQTDTIANALGVDASEYAGVRLERLSKAETIEEFLTIAESTVKTDLESLL